MPSLVRALGNESGPPIDSVRLVTLGGEAARADDVTKLQRVFPRADVLATFGSSEAGTTAAALIPSGSPPVDLDTLWPVPGQQVTVVGDDGVELRAGDFGEIVVVGPGVARGYWRDPPQHTGVFSTTADGVRRARTGDRGRVLPDGRLQVVGRLDHRVKVRGQGVDLAAVEARLAGLRGVRDAVVSAVPASGGATQLVAHVVVDPAEPVAARDLRRGLALHLSDYAIPTRFLFVESLPRTSRNKTDRRALADEAEAHTVEPVEYVPPRDEIEVHIAALFAELLVLDEVGILHDFFELGGDSLTALELLIALEGDYRVDARDLATQPGLFSDHATVEALADLVRARRTVDGGNPVDGVAVPLVVRDDQSGPPVFLVPGVSGNAGILRALAGHLDGRRVYSFWARGMLAPAWPDRRLEVMAGRYAQAIRATVPEGPVVLGGYSFGASLAFEVARALEVQGCAPTLLVNIDSPVRDWRRTRGSTRAELYKERVRAASNAERLRIFANSVQWRVSRAYYRATVGVLPRTLSQQFDVFRIHHDRMVRRYEPTGTYAGAMLVLRSDDRTTDDGDLGWSRRVTGPVTVVQVAGQHERLLREPWVGAVARAINESIARTDGAG